MDICATVFSDEWRLGTSRLSRYSQNTKLPEAAGAVCPCDAAIPVSTRVNQLQNDGEGRSGQSLKEKSPQRRLFGSLRSRASFAARKEDC